MDQTSKSNGKKKVPAVIIRGQSERQIGVAGIDTTKRAGAGDEGSARSRLTRNGTAASQRGS